MLNNESLTPNPGLPILCDLDLLDDDMEVA